MNVQYLSQLHLISSSGTTYCIKGIYSVVQNVYKAKVFFSVPTRMFLCVTSALF
jgi:hypothetical protein